MLLQKQRTCQHRWQIKLLRNKRHITGGFRFPSMCVDVWKPILENARKGKVQTCNYYTCSHSLCHRKLYPGSDTSLVCVRRALFVLFQSKRNRNAAASKRSVCRTPYIYMVAFTTERGNPNKTGFQSNLYKFIIYISLYQHTVKQKQSY